MSAKDISQKKSDQKIIPRNNLRQLRISKNPKMSQWMLALKSGVAQSRISLIENHLINPAQQDHEKLASALNIGSLEIFPNPNGIEASSQKDMDKIEQTKIDEGIEGANPLENLQKGGWNESMGNQG